MKKRILTFALFVSIFACKNDEKKSETLYLNHVGDTHFVAETDSTGFQPCHPDLAYQYYNFGGSARFKGEKPAIERYFRERYKAEENQQENGYFTVRFLVNCEGKSSWFRTEAMDLEYQPKQFHSAISNQLLQLTKALEGWTVAEYEGQTYDYYQYLTFKIENGQLSEILP